MLPVGLGAWIATQQNPARLLEEGKRRLGLRLPAVAAEPAAPKEKKLVLASVRIVHPEPAPGSSTLTLSGRTAPAEQALISSRASGIVSERRVDIGDRAKAGDILMIIEAPEVEQELQRARASVDQIKARLELARVNLVRAEDLEPKGHISEQTLDERRAAKMTADADLAAAMAEVKRLEDVKSFQTVRAPFSGTIVARQVERGDKVSADSSQQSYLLRIARLDELRIEIDVPQSSALKVKPDASAKVVFAELPGETLSARVVRTAGLIDQSSNTMRAELLMQNPDGRIPAGLNGQVMIEIGAVDGAVTIPTNTLLTREGRQMVAIVDDDDNRVALKPVSVARDLGERVVISAGLSPRDRVIVSPNALLRAGDQVEITTPTARATSAQ